MTYRVYVAGPLTMGDIMINVSNAIKAGNELMRRGYIPFVPHVLYFWEGLYQPDLTYDEWLAYDLEWLKVCELMLRLPGQSPGADREEEFAAKEGIPVYYSIDKLTEAYN